MTDHPTYGNSRRPELLRLIEADLKETNAVLSRVVAARDAVRPAAVTVMAAIVGFGLTQEDYRLTVLAVLIVAFSVFLESRHDALYMQLISRARVLEHAVERYVTYLSAQEESQRALLLDEIDSSAALYEFGVNRSFRRTTLKDLVAAVRRRHSYLIYLVLVAVVVAVALVQVATVDNNDTDPVPVCFESVAAVGSDEGTTLSATELRLAPCP